jgi:hypothetical protein
MTASILHRGLPFVGAHGVSKIEMMDTINGELRALRDVREIADMFKPSALSRPTIADPINPVPPIRSTLRQPHCWKNANNVACSPLQRCGRLRGGTQTAVDQP